MKNIISVVSAQKDELVNKELQPFTIALDINTYSGIHDGNNSKVLDSKGYYHKGQETVLNLTLLVLNIDFIFVKVLYKEWEV